MVKKGQGDRILQIILYQEINNEHLLELISSMLKSFYLAGIKGQEDLTSKVQGDTINNTMRENKNNGNQGYHN